MSTNSLSNIIKCSLAAGLVLGLTACSSMPGHADRADAGNADLPEYRSPQVEVLTINQQFIWRMPDANQHFAQFSQHILVDDSVPSRLQEFVVTYKTANHLGNPGMSTMTVQQSDELQISSNGQFVLSEAIPQGFTGRQSYRRLEVARLSVGRDIYLLALANSFMHRPLWLAVFGADGSTVYRAGLPHGNWQFIEHADGFSMVDTRGAGQRLVLHPLVVERR
ncbi:hypothetical protein [Undibacterium sp. TJN19]|uniref:hypothetical protein n=1 Tax=Undibacterium sp. TJN19 TaxID=3413055 RepID=UPI003BF1EA22